MANVNSLPPPPVIDPIVIGGKEPLRTAPAFSDWLFRLQQKVNSAITAASAQLAIQFQFGGSNLGTAGTVTTVNITGPNLVVTRVGDVVTVTERASSRAYAARH